MINTKQFTQEEWNALAIIYRLGIKLKAEFIFPAGLRKDHIEIRPFDGYPHILDKSTFLEKESGTLFTHDRDARIFAENNMVHNPDAKNCFCEYCKDAALNQ